MHLYVYEESVIQSEKTFTIRLFGLIFDCRESYFFLDKDVAFAQDRDHDSLLVKRRNDNHSPGPVIRELVPSSRQRSELSNTILCIFSG